MDYFDIFFLNNMDIICVKKKKHKQLSDEQLNSRCVIYITVAF